MMRRSISLLTLNSPVGSREKRTTRLLLLSLLRRGSGRLAELRARDPHVRLLLRSQQRLLSNGLGPQQVLLRKRAVRLNCPGSLMIRRTMWRRMRSTPVSFRMKSTRAKMLTETLKYQTQIPPSPQGWIRIRTAGMRQTRKRCTLHKGASEVRGLQRHRKTLSTQCLTPTIPVMSSSRLNTNQKVRVVKDSRSNAVPTGSP